MRKLRILYAGSPLASSFVLNNLIKLSKSAGFEISGVLTNPPSSQGRHKELIPTPCEVSARNNNIEVFSFEHLKSESREAISPLKCDLLVCFDYGHIFGPKFLEMFPLGGINLHPSGLPQYRGCTPVPAAILNGDRKLGISVQKISLKTDEGDLLGVCDMQLYGTETTGFLMDGLPDSDGNYTDSPVTNAGYLLLERILLDTIKNYNSETDSFSLPESQKQTGEVSYTPFISKEDGKINWSEPSDIVDRKLRAYTPWPGIWTLKNNTVLKIIKARPARAAELLNLEIPENSVCGTVLPYRKNIGIEILCGTSPVNGKPSVLVVSELQLQGKKSMDYKSFLNGCRDFIGSKLGE